MEQPETSGDREDLEDRRAPGLRDPAIRAAARARRQPKQARPGARRAGRPTGAAVRTLQPAAAGQAVRQSVDHRPEDEPQQSDQDVHWGVLYRPAGSPLTLSPEHGHSRPRFHRPPVILGRSQVEEDAGRVWKSADGWRRTPHQGFLNTLTPGSSTTTWWLLYVRARTSSRIVWGGACERIGSHSPRPARIGCPRRP